MIWFIFIILAIILGIVHSAIEARRQEGSFLTSMPSPLKPKTGDLSLEQAQLAVDNLIADKKLFADPADKTKPLPEGLGPITREFFSRYGTLKIPFGGFVLSATDIRASEYVLGFLSIGHSDDWDVVQWPGGDEVFVVEGSENCEDELECRFPRDSVQNSFFAAH